MSKDAGLWSRIATPSAVWIEMRVYMIDDFKLSYKEGLVWVKLIFEIFCSLKD